MASRSSLLHLLLLLLALSHLFSLNASRFGNLERQLKINYQHFQETYMKSRRRNLEGVEGRMGVELNDYPGSGANNRHVPRPQFGRGCADC